MSGIGQSLWTPCLVLANHCGLTVSGIGQSLWTQCLILAPRPPSARSNVPGPAFRTTMFRRDQVQAVARRQQLKRRGSNSSLDEEIIKAVGKTHSDTEQVATQGHASPEGSSHAVDTGSKQQKIHETEEPEVLSFERPLTEEGRSRLDAVRSVTSVTFKLDNISQAPSRAGSAGSRVPSARTATPASSAFSLRPDPNIVLTHLKTNIYDDTEPDNDDAIYHLKRMRTKLGLVTELPHYGASIKEQMDGIEDRLADPLKYMMEDHVDNGEFLYALPRNRADTRGRYNRYDLQVVSPHVAKSAKGYFTLSAHGVTMVSYF
ncbi:uncharacterized protein LOC144358852 [Saccoglossus kowalevskii]